MDAKTEPHLAALKTALRTLKHSGSDGFEGLLAAVLSEVCGQPFRVASSGSQRGRDGDSAFDQGATYFEAKLYEDAVRQDAVNSKIVDLANDDKGQVDTWILCATSPVSSQHAKKYHGSLAALGIGCVILDWPPETLPTLAVLLAMAASRVERFVLDHSQDPSAVTGIRADLDAVAADGQFTDLSTNLRSMVRDGSVGLGLAKAANRSALTRAFSDRRQARGLFGQPLAPLDKSGLPWAERPTLVQKVQVAVSGPPARGVVLVLGDEGTGKSWLVAKGWCASEPAPLLAAFMAADLSMPQAMNMEELLITKLASLTREIMTDDLRKRWARRFRGWRSNPGPVHVRLLVWVDGLNQVQGVPWPRWIDAMAKFLEEIGGRLIVTTTNWHHAQIRSMVASPIERVLVDDWSESELKAILDAKGIKSDALAADVFDFLRNPRILGIAIELLDANEIERVDELTVGRLLFEHILRHERDAMSGTTAREFVGMLQTRAEEILQRLSRQERDDLTIFKLGQDLGAVSRGRFFEPVAGETDLYAIRKEGLPLALGLALTSILRKEVRTGRDPGARLAEVTEPINALSETSAVVFSALQLSFLQDGCPPEVQAALAKYLVGLQNLTDDLYAAFEALVKRAPAPFLMATHDAAFSRVRLPNARWLIVALHAAATDQANASEISRSVQEWICRHSLAPEIGMFRNAGRDPATEATQLARLRQQLEDRRSALSAPEHEFVRSRLKEQSWEGLTQLHRYAIELLAGRSLENAVPALAGWAFADALNRDIDGPHKQFRELLRFNAVDWLRTRDAIRAACKPFLTAEASNTARRAAAFMLNATGDPDDAAQAHPIFKLLNRDQPRFSFATDPTYSPVDPCDPTAQTPDNIGAIVAANKTIDVAVLNTGRGTTAEDHIFSRSLPALARFDPAAAIEMRRNFARDGIARTELMPLRQAVLALLRDSAILETDIVNRLVSIGSTPPTSESLSDKEAIGDEWLVQQYALRASFPYITGDEQLRILEAGASHGALVDLLEATVPASATELDAALDRAIASGDDNRIAIVLNFAQFSKTPLSSTEKSRLGPLLLSEDRGVRTSALALTGQTRDADLLKLFLATGWDAADCDPKEGYHELWYGSRCLLAAAELKMLDTAEAVDRMGTNFYGFAARMNDEAAQVAADRVDAAFQRAIHLNDVPQFPLVEQPMTVEEGQAPPMLSLVDQPPGSIRQTFEILGESEEGFQQRQKRHWQAFDRFVDRITHANARIMLDDLSWEGFDAIVASDPALAERWKNSLLNVGDSVFRAMHAFATGLARAIAPTDPEGAAQLFARTAAQRPLVNRCTGLSRIPADALAAWTRASIPAVRDLCFARLDGAANDSQIAIELLAASKVGAQEYVKRYVDTRMSAGEPAKTARALLACGYSDDNDHASQTLQRFEGLRGFVGDAHRTATNAYLRNRWSRYWYGKMKVSATPEEFWRCAVLLTKIVDGRFDLWERDCGASGDVFSRFIATIRDGIELRVKKWQSARQSKLFGCDIPDSIFTSG
ncbi:hypothetical protein ACVIGA_000648 [Bradyrhizobium sp. USDA 3240]